MFLGGILSWWYGGGLVVRICKIREHLVNSIDFFSISSLLSTLFAPYKQISAQGLGGAPSFAIQIRAFIDKTISRVIGAFARSFLIIFGVIAISVQLIIEVIFVVIWIIMPAAPVIGALLMIIGWFPL